MADQLINNEAKEAIKNHVLYSMGAGMIPIFIIDIIAITAIQLDMIKQLCVLYHVDYSETHGKALASSLTGTTLSRLAGYTISSALKVIPGIGTLMGGVTLSVTAGATTYSLGMVFAMHFQSGGNLLNLDPEVFRDFYNEQMDKGKAIVKKWKEENKKEEEHSEENEDLLKKLKDAEKLLKSGALTQEEFDIIKERLLQQFMKKNKKNK